jgi:hypothetical protein
MDDGGPKSVERSWRAAPWIWHGSCTAIRDRFDIALVKISHHRAKKFDVHTGIGPPKLDAHQYDSFILIE